MTDTILTENRDGVLVVTFNRPEKKNAINNEMWVGLRETFRPPRGRHGGLCAAVRCR